MQTVVQDWLSQLSFKMQTVLLSALRGCDGDAKEAAGKIITWALRSVILFDAEAGAHGEQASLFLQNNLTDKFITEFCGDLDRYSVHWLMHTAHACEIVGYYHPAETTAQRFARLYFNICQGLHLLPESLRHLELRLRDGVFTEADRQRYHHIYNIVNGGLTGDYRAQHPTLINQPSAAAPEPSPIEIPKFLRSDQDYYILRGYRD